MKLKLYIYLSSIFLISCHTVNLPERIEKRNFSPVKIPVSVSGDITEYNFSNKQENRWFYFTKHSQFILLDPVFKHPHALKLHKSCNYKPPNARMIGNYLLSLSTLFIIPFYNKTTCSYEYTITGPAGNASGKIESSRTSLFGIFPYIASIFFRKNFENAKEEEAKRVMAAIEEDLFAKLSQTFFIIPKKVENVNTVLFAGYVFKKSGKKIIVASRSGMGVLRPGQIITFEKPGSKAVAGRAAISLISYTFVECRLIEGDSVEKYDHAILYSDNAAPLRKVSNLDEYEK